EQRGNADAHPGIWSEQLPVPIEIAVVVQSSTKSRSREFTGIEVEVRLREPGRKRGCSDSPGEPSSISRHHASGHTLAKKQPSHRVAHVALEFGLSDTRLLKVQLVIERRVRLRHRTGGPSRPT